MSDVWVEEYLPGASLLIAPFDCKCSKMYNWHYLRNIRRWNVHDLEMRPLSKEHKVLPTIYLQFDMQACLELPAVGLWLKDDWELTDKNIIDLNLTYRDVC